MSSYTIGLLVGIAAVLIVAAIVKCALGTGR